MLLNPFPRQLSLCHSPGAADPPLGDPLKFLQVQCFQKKMLDFWRARLAWKSQKSLNNSLTQEKHTKRNTDLLTPKCSRDTVKFGVMCWLTIIGQNGDSFRFKTGFDLDRGQKQLASFYLLNYLETCFSVVGENKGGVCLSDQRNAHPWTKEHYQDSAAQRIYRVLFEVPGLIKY